MLQAMALFVTLVVNAGEIRNKLVQTTQQVHWGASVLVFSLTFCALVRRFDLTKPSEERGDVFLGEDQGMLW